MKQHGFARTSAWDVVATRCDDAASATLRLVPSDESRGAYPWEFVASFTYTLRGQVLRIEQTFTNHSATPMPFGAGFHPYFHVPQREKTAARIGTAATHAFDNVTKTTAAREGVDLGQAEVDLHLVDHGARPWSSSSTSASARERRRAVRSVTAALLALCVPGCRRCGASDGRARRVRSRGGHASRAAIRSRRRAARTRRLVLRPRNDVRARSTIRPATMPW